jgi:hypothetical protein
MIFHIKRVLIDCTNFQSTVTRQNAYERSFIFFEFMIKRGNKAKIINKYDYY